MLRPLALPLIAATIAIAAHAAEQNPAPPPEVRAVRVSAAPVIDGELSDAAWSSAPEITAFVQREPDENQAPTEATAVRIIYDDDAIYFGVRLDDRHPVTAFVARRDEEIFTDLFTVDLDPHHDHRSGAGFTVSAADVQRDYVWYNDTSTDAEWDAVWSSATKITPAGWTLEIRIPYSQLRFPKRDVHLWGINLKRFIARRHEDDYLAMAPRGESLGVSRFGHLVGIEGVAPRRSVELVPYVVGRADFLGTVTADDPLNDSTDYGVDGGLDVRYPLTSNLTLAGTFNPDFGQVEVDPAVVNLSQFETFYPEKRPFFLEGATLFDFGRSGSNSSLGFNFSTPDLFYSRRIGREPQMRGALRGEFIDAPRETTILGAAKITGKTVGGWTVAALDAITEEEDATFIRNGTREEAVIEPLTNYFVSRFARDLGSSGRVGAMFTSVNRDLDGEAVPLRKNAYTAATDGYWAFGKRDVIWEWSLAGTRVDGSAESIAATQLSSARYYQRPDAGHVDFDPSRTSLSGWGARTMLAKQTGKWRYNFQVESFSPGFETNDVGYMTRTDTTATHATVIYNNPETKGVVRHRNGWFGKYQNWNLDGDLIANGVYGSAFVLFTNYWDVSCQGGYGAETLDDRLTRGGPLALNPASWSGACNGSTDSRKPFYFSFELSRDWDDGGSFAEEIETGYRYRPLNNLTFSIEPELTRSRTVAQYIRTVADTTSPLYGRRYVFGDLEQTVLEVGTRLDWTLSSSLTFQLYLQPFVAAGDYSDIKELSRARSYDFDIYGADRGTIDFDEGRNEYTIDPDGSGTALPFALRNPDFNLRSLRGSAVLRWEFRPGSALYVAWNENRAGVVERGNFDASRDFSAIADTDADDVILVKVSYWIPM